jgi:hypothetical protein
LLLDLPFGLGLVLLLVLLQSPLTAPLWEPHRSFLRSAITRFVATSRCWLAAVPAVFIGTWTHLLWDSCTHRDTWVVRHFPILKRPLAPQSEHVWELFHVLQYASSVLGLTVLALWYAVALRKSGLQGTGRSWRKWLLGACVIASLASGAFRLSMNSAYGALSNYMMFSIVLERAMVSFALLYLVAGLVITAVQTQQSEARRSVRSPAKESA